MQIECNGCQQSFKLDQVLSERKLDNDISEVGLICPGCQKWYHSYFSNDELENLRNQLGNSPIRKKRREYKKKFDRLQKKLKKYYGSNRNRPPFAVNENDGTHQAIS